MQVIFILAGSIVFVSYRTLIHGPLYLGGRTVSDLLQSAPIACDCALVRGCDGALEQGRRRLGEEQRVEPWKRLTAVKGVCGGAT